MHFGKILPYPSGGMQGFAWWAFLFDSFLFVLYLYENRHIILIIPEDFCQGRPFLVHKIVHFNENSATYK